MCEIRVYLLENQKESLLMESVEFLKADGDKIVMSNIFGEKKELKAAFKEFDNSNGRILLIAR